MCNSSGLQIQALTSYSHLQYCHKSNQDGATFIHANNFMLKIGTGITSHLFKKNLNAGVAMPCTKLKNSAQHG